MARLCPVCGWTESATGDCRGGDAQGEQRVADTDSESNQAQVSGCCVCVLPFTLALFFFSFHFFSVVLCLILSSTQMMCLSIPFADIQCLFYLLNGNLMYKM